MMMEKHDFISAHKSRFPVSRLCDLLDVSKSWFYERPQIAPNLLNRNFHAVKGNCRDNTPLERFFSSLKTGCVHRTRFKTFKQAKAALFDYIEVFYNRQRLHSTIGYKTPLEAFNEMIAQAA